jgi:hypothetical protein
MPAQAGMKIRRNAVRALIVLATALLGYLAVVVTLPNFAASAAPGLALRVRPSHAGAHVRQAELALGSDPRNPAVDSAAQHAREALRRDPTQAAAARILGLSLALRGGRRRAEGLFEYSNEMSRRDVPTQLWLLEQRVAHNDIEGALRHYAIVLRVAPSTKQIVFPVLTGALAYPYLVEPIAELARDGERWRGEFLYYVASNARNPADAASLFLKLSQLGAPPEPEHISGVVTRLLQAGDTRRAGALYRIIDRQWRLADVGSQLDGGFSRTAGVPPLGWEYNSDLAWRGDKPGRIGDPALHINVSASGQGWAARRRLILRPGSYRFDAVIGTTSGAPDGQLRFALVCTEGGEPQSRIEVPLQSVHGRAGGILQVPLGCPAPWLQIAIAEQETQTPAAIWLDELRLTPAG